MLSVQNADVMLALFVTISDKSAGQSVEMLVRE